MFWQLIGDEESLVHEIGCIDGKLEFVIHNKDKVDYIVTDFVAKLKCAEIETSVTLFNEIDPQSLFELGEWICRRAQQAHRLEVEKERESEVFEVAGFLEEEFKDKYMVLATEGHINVYGDVSAKDRQEILNTAYPYEANFFSYGRSI